MAVGGWRLAVGGWGLMPSETQIGRLIGDLRVDRRLTQRKLAELAGTNHTYLSKIENGRLGTLPSAAMLIALADVLEVDRDWLLTRCGRPPEGLAEAIDADPDFFQRLARRVPQEEQADSRSVRRLRLLGDVPAGVPVEAIEGYDEFDLAERFAPDGHFLLRVRGESMIEAGIRDGDLAIVRSQPECENGVVAVVLVDGAEATLKTVHRDRKTVRLVPANSEMEPIEVSAKRVEVRGVVVGIVRLGL